MKVLVGTFSEYCIFISNQVLMSKLRNPTQGRAFGRQQRGGYPEEAAGVQSGGLLRGGVRGQALHDPGDGAPRRGRPLRETLPPRVPAHRGKMSDIHQTNTSRWIFYIRTQVFESFWIRFCFFVGVDFIHTKNIIHLDIKPFNILFSNKVFCIINYMVWGTKYYTSLLFMYHNIFGWYIKHFLLLQNSDFGLKLIDFGLARNLSEGQGVKIEALQGTIGWWPGKCKPWLRVYVMLQSTWRPSWSTAWWRGRGRTCGVWGSSPTPSSWGDARPSTAAAGQH